LFYLYNDDTYIRVILSILTFLPFILTFVKQPFYLTISLLNFFVSIIESLFIIILFTMQSYNYCHYVVQNMAAYFKTGHFF